jgi:hypothetical protein
VRPNFSKGGREWPHHLRSEGNGKEGESAMLPRASSYFPSQNEAFRTR